MPGAASKEKGRYHIDNIEISAKTTRGESYSERCRFLIYQESPDISGILLTSLDAQSMHS